MLLQKQEAMVVEFAECPEWKEKVKLLPQRALDAYSFEQPTSHHCQDPYYQQGDFLIHFAGVRNNDRMKGLFHKYYKQGYGPDDKDLLAF